MPPSLPPESEQSRRELERLTAFLDEFLPTPGEMEEALRRAAVDYARHVLPAAERAGFLIDILGFEQVSQVLLEERQRRKLGFAPPAGEMDRALCRAAEHYALHLLLSADRVKFLAIVLGCDKTAEVLGNERKARQLGNPLGYRTS
jgi:hypothetical protein